MTDHKVYKDLDMGITCVLLFGTAVVLVLLYIEILEISTKCARMRGVRRHQNRTAGGRCRKDCEIVKWMILENSAASKDRLGRLKLEYDSRCALRITCKTI